MTKNQLNFIKALKETQFYMNIVEKLYLLPTEDDELFFSLKDNYSSDDKKEIQTLMNKYDICLEDIIILDDNERNMLLEIDNKLNEGPKYKRNDGVLFTVDGMIKEGTIISVNSQGSTLHPDIITYDILISDKSILYKEIAEEAIQDN